MSLQWSKLLLKGLVLISSMIDHWSEDLNELLHIFGPASMVRVVGSMLTPSGRVKVQHFVRDPVLLKYDGGTNELSIGFGVSAKFMPMERKTAVTRGY